jgi:hypothetical protein
MTKDESHFRFFDRSTAQEMITKAALMILSKEALGNFPLPTIRNLFLGLAKNIDHFLSEKWARLLGFQFVFITGNS